MQRSVFCRRLCDSLAAAVVAKNMDRLEITLTLIILGLVGASCASSSTSSNKVKPNLVLADVRSTSNVARPAPDPGPEIIRDKLGARWPSQQELERYEQCRRGAIAEAMTRPAIDVDPELSSLEQQIVARLNQLRQKPSSYVAALDELRGYYDKANRLRIPGQLGFQTIEGPYAVDEAIRAVEALEPLSAWSTLAS